MSFADCMQDLEKMNEFSEVKVKPSRTGLFETIVKKVSRIVQIRPTAQQLKN